MKIFQANQIRTIDKFTSEHEPVASIDLMERAALTCERKLNDLLHPKDKIYVICGKGNNGGDGLAIGRLLFERGFHVKVLVVNYPAKFSDDALANYDLFKSKFPEEIIEINTVEEFKEKINEPAPVIIDAIFGSGLNKPVEGLAAEVITELNETAGKIISIDVPSGLFTDRSSKKNKYIVKADLILTLQFPKLAFFMPENKNYSSEFKVLDIGLHKERISAEPTSYYYLTRQDVASLLKKRNKFDHKGTFGHALLIAGSKGKTGAAVICARACLRSGTGLLTVHSVEKTLSALATTLPEAMSSTDESTDHISAVGPMDDYNAVGFGPGAGMHEDTQKTLKGLLQNYPGKLVIDADGLNILSENKTWLPFIPPSTILTPHVKEFERLAGKSENDFERLTLLKEFSVKYSCIVILKGAYSAIAMPDGNIFFNSTGNPGLAKGGSGDALTGIILGLLARGYNAPRAAVIGTYIHGLAADLCLKKMSMESILISDVIDQLPKAFLKLEKVSDK